MLIIILLSSILIFIAQDVNDSLEIVQLTQQNPMLLLSVPDYDMSELIVSEEINDKIHRILNEYKK